MIVVNIVELLHQNAGTRQVGCVRRRRCFRRRGRVGGGWDQGRLGRLRPRGVRCGRIGGLRRIDLLRGRARLRGGNLPDRDHHRAGRAPIGGSIHAHGVDGVGANCGWIPLVDGLTQSQLSRGDVHLGDQVAVHVEENRGDTVGIRSVGVENDRSEIEMHPMQRAIEPRTGTMPRLSTGREENDAGEKQRGFGDVVHHAEPALCRSDVILSAL